MDELECCLVGLSNNIARDCSRSITSLQAEIGEAPEWQEVNKLFCDACDTYVNIAMGNRPKIRGDLFLWVKTQIELYHHLTAATP